MAPIPELLGWLAAVEAPVGNGKLAALTGCVACQKVPLTGWVACQKVPDTGCVVAEPSTLSAPEAFALNATMFTPALSFIPIAVPVDGKAEPKLGPEPAPKLVIWLPVASRISTARGRALPLASEVIALPAPSCSLWFQLPDWVAATVPLTGCVAPEPSTRSAPAVVRESGEVWAVV